MPLLLVRNTQRGPTVFSNMKNNEAVEWAGAGDPMQDDLQQVPEHFLEDVNFMKAVNRGILVVENADDPEIAAKFQQQSAAWAKLRDEKAQRAQATVEQEENNDLLMVPCVGPATRGTGECGQGVPLAEKQRKERAPLCPTHTHLAPQYVMSEHPSEFEADGHTPKVIWSRVLTTPDALPSQVNA